MMLYISEDFRRRLNGCDGFDDLMAIDGEIYRKVANRHTLRFERGGKSYFIKVHRGVGWNEIFKNLLTLRMPILGAKNEWLAIRRLNELGVRTPTAVAYGIRGTNPARQESFIVTEDLGDSISLEDLCANWRTDPPAPATKWRLIAQVADIARRLHGNGVNHRDFYLCHFMRPIDVAAGQDLTLIDLHRVQLRSKTPQRWVVKDIGGLYFSAMDIGLTRRDVYRFIRAYRARPLRQTLEQEADFLRMVERRALRLYNE